MTLRRTRMILVWSWASQPARGKHMAAGSARERVSAGCRDWVNMTDVCLLQGSRLDFPDLLVISAYFICVLAVGIWSSRKSQRGSVSGYFLASRNMHWIPVGSSLFASNIGSGHFIGLAGAGAASGLAAHGYEQAAIYGLLMLGWLFVPVYMSCGVYTMPEYIRLRFGGQRIRVYLSCLSLALYSFTKIAADLYAGALFIQLALNKNSDEWLYISVLLLLGVAAMFTIIGGLTAVVYTDLVQTVLMVSGAVVLSVMSFQAVGGYNSLVESFPYATASIRAVGANNKTCGEPPADFMHLFRTVDYTKSDYPWTGMTLGMAVIQIWYWCTDQVIVQRTLASRSMLHAKGGTVLAAYLKYLPLWIMVFPGMAARILYPDRVACASPQQCTEVCGNERGCTNSAYAELVLNLLPSGLRGLMLAVMMAALMSSLTSVFNSASTIFTIDIWTLVRKKFGGKWQTTKPSDMELIIVGRTFVASVVVVSVLWIPVIQNTGNSQLFDYLNMVISFLASPICAVFLLAVFCPRTNEPGAFWGLMAGLGIGIVRFVAEFCFTVPPCGSDEPDLRPDLIKTVVGTFHYLHFCFLCCAITAIVSIGVSIMTEPIPPECLYRLTFWSRKDGRVRQPMKKTDKDTEATKKSATQGSVQNSVSLDTDNGCTVIQQMSCEQTPKGVSLCRRMFNTVCQVPSDNDGAGSPAQAQPSEEEKAQRAADFLNETPFWRKFININAVICITLSTFVYGFYA